MGHVTLFSPCYVSLLRPDDTGHARRVLEALGDEVSVLGGRCCGQPAFNSGFRDEARSVGRELLRAARDCDVVVVPSGSCTSMVQHYLPTLFEGQRREAADALAHRFVELSDYVSNHAARGTLSLGLRGSIAYHDSCHCRRELRLTSTALELLQSVEGLEVRRLVNEDECCGFGGTFSTKLPEVSTAMLRNKLDDIEMTGARVVVSTDLSCLIHLEAGARGTGRNVEAWSMAELLARALR